MDFRELLDRVESNGRPATHSASLGRRPGKRSRQRRPHPRGFKPQRLCDLCVFHSECHVERRGQWEAAGPPRSRAGALGQERVRRPRSESPRCSVHSLTVERMCSIVLAMAVRPPDGILVNRRFEEDIRVEHLPLDPKSPCDQSPYRRIHVSRLWRHRGRHRIHRIWFDRRGSTMCDASHTGPASHGASGRSRPGCDRPRCGSSTSSALARAGSPTTHDHAVTARPAGSGSSRKHRTAGRQPHRRAGGRVDLHREADVLQPKRLGTPPARGGDLAGLDPGGSRSRAPGRGRRQRRRAPQCSPSSPNRPRAARRSVWRPAWMSGRARVLAELVDQVEREPDRVGGVLGANRCPRRRGS